MKLAGEVRNDDDPWTWNGANGFESELRVGLYWLAEKNFSSSSAYAE